MEESLRRVRGRRGGIKTRIEEARRKYNIPVRVTTMQHSYAKQREVNFSNLINLCNVSPSRTSSQTNYSCNYVPTIMLSNTMSLVPKLVEVQEYFQRNKIDIGFITETWLKD